MLFNGLAWTLIAKNCKLSVFSSYQNLYVSYLPSECISSISRHLLSCLLLQVIMRIYNNNNNLLIAVLLLHLFNIGRIDATDCVYSTADGELDLRALSYSNRPRFQDIPDTDTKILLKYSFNPCFSFNGKAPCTKAAACASKMILSSD